MSLPAVFVFYVYLICILCLWDANERLATESMMDKTITVTDTKTLQGEDPDKRDPYSASISLNHSYFRVLPAFAAVTFSFVRTVKTTLTEYLPVKFGSTYFI